MLTELSRARERSPKGLAVRSITPDGGWIETTWAELHAEATAAAARARRVPAGRPVVVIVDGTAASIATIFGVMAAGVDVLLLEERSSYLSDPASPVHALDAPVLVGPADAGDGIARFESYADFREHGATAVAAGPRTSEILQLTSGSTGVPRIARQTVPNVLVGGVLYRELFEMTPDDRVLIAVPLAHSYGLAGLCSALLAAATVVTIPRFSLSSLVTGIRDGATMLLGTPLLYRLLTPVLAARGPAGLRTALSAGGPMPTDNVDAITAALGTPVRQIYGTTEAGLISCVPQAASSWPTGAAGWASPGVELRIDGDPGSDTGRLFVRTPMMFTGYRGSDEPGVTEDGFYDTGDNARVTADGHVFVLGRRDNIVNIGGRKVSPQRIETVLATHPAVRESFVYGVERSDHEQEMHAAVVLSAPVGVDDLLDHCRTALAAYEVPHRVHVLDRLPRNSMGKVDRQQLLAATPYPQHTEPRSLHMSTTAVPNTYGLGGVGETARWMAASRARENRRPDRLFEDPFAEPLAGPDGPGLLTYFHPRHASETGQPYLPIRTRWFDDFLMSNVGEGHQVVGLAAGLDTRAFRLAWPARVTLHEVDQPAVLAYKAERLPKAVERCEKRIVVPINLAEDWVTALTESGFDPSKPTVWFVEGLLFYLPEELAAEVLRKAASLSAPGSKIAADLIGTGIFNFPYMREFLRRLQEADSPWVFGTDDPAGFLRSTGWSNVHVSEPGDAGANFGRWPQAASSKTIPNLPRIFLVSAEQAG
ncbi:methyltransferase (TIGR00027 family) [Allocatelliglobosispora scoriae]|uniref:Methyltransferase (TIGR00027 family) n=1 Tax=Allocatelliglobosispora scoriae TaxID=643052 RepID=A0A841BLR5_9ACTN|nr:SAM-dependent methyltransferase [Allocatelliglobosispora scoriae]MBB5870027.1 methyltransferase (TIGR00027 family) [Allocatelliglobosispora scoriae]